MKALGITLIMIGMVMMALDTIGSIGYGLYLWGGLGGGFAESAWNAFVVWMKVFASGALIAILGLLLGGLE